MKVPGRSRSKSRLKDLNLVGDKTGYVKGEMEEGNNSISGYIVKEVDEIRRLP